MLGNMQIYSHDVESRGLVEELRVADLWVTNQSTIRVRISGHPQMVQFFLLNTDVLVQEEAPLGRIDSHGWLYSPTTNLSWYWMLSPWELQKVEEMRAGHDLHLALRGSGMGRILSEEPVRETSHPVPVRAHADLNIPASQWESVGYE